MTPAGVEFIDENGGRPGVRLRRQQIVLGINTLSFILNTYYKSGLVAAGSRNRILVHSVGDSSGSGLGNVNRDAGHQGKPREFLAETKPSALLT